MKIILILIGTIFSSTLLAQNVFVGETQKLTRDDKKSFDFQYPMTTKSRIFNSYLRLQSRSLKELENVKYIKEEMINGNMVKALSLLNEAQFTDSYTKVIYYRYLAINHFLLENYEQSLEYLNQPILQSEKYFKRICLLKTLNEIILNKTQRFSVTWENCKNATFNNSPSFHLWMNILVSLKMNKSSDLLDEEISKITVNNLEERDLMLFTKLALYLNKSDLILNQLKSIKPDSLENEKFQELIASLYYREGQLNKAYQFVKDIDLPNANLIKANLFIALGNKEVAMQYIEKTLKVKQDSLNALERAIPISWVQKDWQRALDYTKRLSDSSKTTYEKDILEAVLLTQIQDYQKAYRRVGQIIYHSNNSQSFIVNQLYSYLNLMLHKIDQSNEYSSVSCSSLDIVSCWLGFQLESWDDYSYTIKKKEQRLENPTELIDNFLANLQQQEPLSESKYIEQRDIEELDDALIIIQAWEE